MYTKNRSPTKERDKHREAGDVFYLQSTLDLHVSKGDL